MSFRDFFRAVFSDKGQPSSARILSFWLSISSMALIWFCVRHAFALDREAAMVWVGGLPGIIYALAAFAISPFGIGKIAGIWDKKVGSGSVDEEEVPTPKPRRRRKKKISRRSGV